MATRMNVTISKYNHHQYKIHTRREALFRFFNATSTASTLFTLFNGKCASKNPIASGEGTVSSQNGFCATDWVDCCAIDWGDCEATADIKLLISWRRPDNCDSKPFKQEYANNETRIEINFHIGIT